MHDQLVSSIENYIPYKSTNIPIIPLFPNVLFIGRRQDLLLFPVSRFSTSEIDIARDKRQPDQDEARLTSQIFT